MSLKVGDIVKNGHGEEFEILATRQSKYSIVARRLINGEEYTFTKEGYYQKDIKESNMNLILDGVEEPTAYDECVPVEEPTACEGFEVTEEECVPVDGNSYEYGTCETDKELAVYDVVDSITKYQVKLTKLLRVSLVDGESFDEVVYLTTLIKDSVELKETIKGL